MDGPEKTRNALHQHTLNKSNLKGFRIKLMYEVFYEKAGKKTKSSGYFEEQAVAEALACQPHENDSLGSSQSREAFVLTDGKEYFALEVGEPLQMMNDAQVRTKICELAKRKLTQQEIVLLEIK